MEVVQNVKITSISTILPILEMNQN